MSPGCTHEGCIRLHVRQPCIIACQPSACNLIFFSFRKYWHWLHTRRPHAVVCPSVKHNYMSVTHAQLVFSIFATELHTLWLHTVASPPFACNLFLKILSAGCTHVGRTKFHVTVHAELHVRHPPATYYLFMFQKILLLDCTMACRTQLHFRRPRTFFFFVA